jgi:purine-binding chemotaxis protein CheW
LQDNLSMTTTTATAAAPGSSTLAGKYLTFKLGPESYGIPVLKIREIIRQTAITPVPQMPPHVKGVINLRGKIIPVADLHAKFGLPLVEASERTCIVVAQVRTAAGTPIQLGLLVDDVEEVTQIGAAELEEAPEFGAALSTEYLLGMAKLKGRVAILLDIDRVLTSESGALVPRPATV